MFYKYFVSFSCIRDGILINGNMVSDCDEMINSVRRIREIEKCIEKEISNGRIKISENSVCIINFILLEDEDETENSTRKEERFRD